MSDTIDATLTPEEQALLVEYRKHPGQPVVAFRSMGLDAILPTLSLGFTHEDADLVRRCAEGCDGQEDEADNERIFPDEICLYGRDVKRFRDLADRIAALLPPEGP